jgi:ABC-type transporter Mla MlaB component
MMVLVVSDELTISTIVEEKARLMAALERGEDIDVDARKVREVDVAGLQVLLAVKREVEFRGKTFSLPATMCSEHLARSLVLAGLDDALIAKDLGREANHG